jgi:hypothetical protein
MIALKRGLLVFAFQQAWHHHFHAAYLYQVLAGRSDNRNTNLLLRTLSKNAMQQARLEAIGLAFLHAPIPDERDVKINTFGDMFLLSCGLRLTMTWLAWLDWLFTQLPAMLRK